jgi:hypothetical protein
MNLLIFMQVFGQVAYFTFVFSVIQLFMAILRSDYVDVSQIIRRSAGDSCLFPPYNSMCSFLVNCPAGLISITQIDRKSTVTDDQI